MTDEQAARIITDEVERRFSDIGALIEETIDYHFDVLDKKVPGNPHGAGDVYGIERYLCAPEDDGYHLRVVRRTTAVYLKHRIETYPSDMKANGGWYLGYGAAGVAATMALSKMGPEAAAAGLAVFGLGVFFLVFHRARKWRDRFADLCATHRLLSAGGLDGPIADTLEQGRQRYLDLIEGRHVRTTDS